MQRHLENYDTDEDKDGSCVMAQITPEQVAMPRIPVAGRVAGGSFLSRVVPSAGHQCTSEWVQHRKLHEPWPTVTVAEAHRPRSISF